MFSSIIQHNEFIQNVSHMAEFKETLLSPVHINLNIHCIIIIIIIIINFFYIIFIIIIILLYI